MELEEQEESQSTFSLTIVGKVTDLHKRGGVGMPRHKSLCGVVHERAFPGVSLENKQTNQPTKRQNYKTKTK